MVQISQIITFMNPTALFLAIIGPGSCHALAFGAGAGKTLARRTQINRNKDRYTLISSHSSSSSSSQHDYDIIVSSRKNFLSMTSSFSVSSLGVIILLGNNPIQYPPTVNADQPFNTNLLHQSTTEGMEDPMVVFGKSLTTQTVEPRISTTENSNTAPSMQVGGDLDTALTNMLGESQKKRTINPLTHG